MLHICLYLTDNSDTGIRRASARQRTNGSSLTIMSNAQKQRLNALQASAGAVILETTLSIITDFYAKSKDIGIDNDVLQEFRSAVKDCIENRRPSAGMIEEAPIQLSDEQMESDSADEDDSVAESSSAKHNKTKPLPRRPLHRYPGNLMPCDSYWDT